MDASTVQKKAVKHIYGAQTHVLQAFKFQMGEQHDYPINAG